MNVFLVLIVLCAQFDLRLCKAEDTDGYLVWVKTQQAVDLMKKLASKGAVNQGECKSITQKLDCSYILESAIYGAYCQLKSSELVALRECLGNDLNGFQRDGIISHASRTRSQITNSSGDFSEPELEDGDYDFEQTIQLPQTKNETQEKELKNLGSQLENLLNGAGPLSRSAVGGSQSDQILKEGFKIWPLPDGLWNLDRIDQKLLPLDSKYTFGAPNSVGTGAGVTIYVVDTGVRTTHVEFEGWEIMNDISTFDPRATPGLDTIDDNGDASDCDGHGTHVASVAIGKGVGVAKQANVVGVRVLDCQGQGRTGKLVTGLDWVSKNVKKPAVVTLSLGLQKDDSITKALEETIRYMIKEQQITFVVASGNSAQNYVKNVVTSCDVSPAHMPEVITVAASDLQTKFGYQRLYMSDNKEGIYYQSNTGSCVDIFAPGVDIYGACGGFGRCQQTNDFAYAWQSGTSMAVPHVAGAAAIFLGQVPYATPAEVKRVLVGVSTPNQVKSDIMQPNTPSNLLYTGLQDMLLFYASN